jgi:hypothetical protein
MTNREGNEFWLLLTNKPAFINTKNVTLHEFEPYKVR